jgi:choline dehydrogenase-like flavoprotein
MSHPASVVFGLFDEPTHPHRGVTGGDLISREGYDEKQPAPGAFGSRQWVAGQSVKPNGLLGIALSRPELYGAALDAFLRDATRHFANMTAFCEETSTFENRIELDASRQDRHGLPVARVVNQLPEENARRPELAREEGLAVMRAAGARETWAGGRVPIHLAGGTVMGDDPGRSVTKGYGQTHEVENLFVAGASLFPTIAAVNPTATLSALALRTAAYLREERQALVR